MSSFLQKCPVCERELNATLANFQLHVNKHLDDGEEEESKKVAFQLSSDDGNPPSPNAERHVAEEPLGPAERMMREVEEQDAALASQIAAVNDVTGMNSTLVSLSLGGSALDSAEIFYANVQSVLFPHIDGLEGVGRKKVHIASKMDLFCSNLAGLGWDCGFRNIQMLFSALLHDPACSQYLRTVGISEVPSVPEIAGRIEDAWKQGYDPEGAANFGGSLLDKEVWIGATEVFVLFRSISFDVFVKDFETPTDADRRNMFLWILQHFNEWCNGKSCSVHRHSFLGPRKRSLVPSIFCQWQGHSVTIIGAEKSRSGEVNLLVLDPSRGFYKSLVDRRTSRMSLVRRGIDHAQFAQPRFQLVSLSQKKLSSPANTNVRETRWGRLKGLRPGGRS
ncbi:unnamed protein product [Chondrus crispus]|uniref:UFSP1/2/DUB catalytic domain-containing protein n=1 Tax=Chondrus crispus TaxID=2769 RepID=R7QE46_CHOCR|nr:unnamed protein product [Chondrus crispus]CDF35705.1 unnamed protein product [Chondrus crispus]|eukprot:XP_005715524.1 unnamed protein product [Chondrus crispus]